MIKKQQLVYYPIFLKFMKEVFTAKFILSSRIYLLSISGDDREMERNLIIVDDSFD